MDELQESSRILLANWFLKNGRALPWRPEDLEHTRDPYGTWISETLLQQTQVETVRERWIVWMQRFPSIAHLAAATQDEVLQCWQGLGYYSRARNLHKAAQILVESYGGVLPHNFEDLVALPGIGPYTAGAIRAFAYRIPTAFADGNMARVWSRYHLILAPYFGMQKASPYQDAANTWCLDTRGPLLSEAVMELGALICRSQKPQCSRCPLAADCGALAKGLENELPPAKPRSPTIAIEGHATVVRWGNRVLLQRDATQLWLGHAWTFPIHTGNTDDPLERLPWIPLDATRTLSALLVRHAITRYRFRLRPCLYSLSAEQAPPQLPPGEWLWTDVEDLPRTLVSSLPLKIWRALTKPS